MTSKQNIQSHLDGISACDAKDYELALLRFKKIASPSAPIIFNIASCYLRLGKNDQAIESFLECISRDKYMAIGHFQLGVAQLLCHQYDAAAKSFKDALTSLRGNEFLDYKQLNVPCKLYASEVNFNHGLAVLFAGDRDGASCLMQTAGRTVTDNSRHTAIPAALDAVQKNNWSFFGNSPSTRVIQLPLNAFYRVSKDKIQGLTTSTNFMAPAKVVSAINDEYSFVGFVGARKLQEASSGGRTPPANRKTGPPVGPPPSVPPPRRPPPSPKSTNLNKGGRSSPSVVSDLQTKFDDKFSFEEKNKTRQVPNENIKLTLKCEFSFDVSKASSFDEILQKVSGKFRESSMDMAQKLQQGQLLLSVNSDSSNANIKTRDDWHPAWSSATDGKKDSISLQLQEKPDYSVKSPSRNLRPSRPAPQLK